jgi:hypothetical protein
MAKNKGGRPPKLTPETVNKLEEAFAIDATVEEACFYAGISRQTYYEWIKDDPKLADRMEAMRNRPVLKARKTVVDALTDPDHAKWYLERKSKKEFSSRTELTGKEGAPIETKDIGVMTQEEIDEYLKAKINGSS